MLKNCMIFMIAFAVFEGRLLAQSTFPFKAAALTNREDLSVKMVSGINSFLLTETERLQKDRTSNWKRDFSSRAAFSGSISGQRTLLSARVGIAEKRVAPRMEVLNDEQLKPISVMGDGYTVLAVRWQTLENLSSEGILVKPASKVVARVILIPDADMEPELLAGLTSKPQQPGFATALLLAKAGVEVIIPTLINRATDFSGNPSLKLKTTQPHREWIYRQAYTIGRHVIGYELQKVFAALDWFQKQNEENNIPVPLGVAGYGEGGLLALYAAAIDERITTTLISGYFNQRESLWQEPIYRNVFGLLKTFGDAELAAMAWPRKVVIEAAAGPELLHKNSGATPAVLKSPDALAVKEEFKRAQSFFPTGTTSNILLIEASTKTSQPLLSANSLTAFLNGIKVNYQPAKATAVWVNSKQRQERLVREMNQKVQLELNTCERTRNQAVWKKLNQGDTLEKDANKEILRTEFANVLGKLPTPSIPFNAKARIYQQTEKWTSYEVMLDVFTPDVFAWGILVVPKGIKPGEKRPVIVCQHGLEGLPSDVVTTDSTAKNYHYYKGYATRLAEKGYISFAPHNPYRGQDSFRVIQRKANPIGLTLFSVIVSQHERIVEWLQQLDFVDPAKVAMYGLSYGGKTAMRVPALVKGYALSICSADFNEWVRKVSTTEHDFGYVYTGEYDMPEWDLGHTFNYAEMAALIAPRPFMVERGHFDGVGTDEWVNYEFAKVRRYYNLLGLPQRVAIEHFAGPHSINGKGTFDFLDTHLLDKK